MPLYLKGKDANVLAGEGEGSVVSGFESKAEGKYSSAEGGLDYSYSVINISLTSSDDPLTYSYNANHFNAKIVQYCIDNKYPINTIIEIRDAETKNVSGYKQVVCTGFNTELETITFSGQLSEEPFSKINFAFPMKSEGKDVTLAKGDASHAENCSEAIGVASHAEGCSSSIGDFSHAEGQSTKAYGYGSHTEGDRTITSPTAAYSHAEGHFSNACNAHAHAEGTSTISSGKGAHAENYNTTASGDYSHAEGGGTKATGKYSHAEGKDSVASGEISHAGGLGCTASAYASVSFGSNSNATNTASVAIGDHVNSTQKAEFACGKYNNSQEDTLFSIGIGTKESNRKNALEVKKNGDIYILIDGVPTKLQDLLKK